MIQDTVEHD